MKLKLPIWLIRRFTKTHMCVIINSPYYPARLEVYTTFFKKHRMILSKIETKEDGCIILEDVRIDMDEDLKPDVKQVQYYVDLVEADELRFRWSELAIKQYKREMNIDVTELGKV